MRRLRDTNSEIGNLVLIRRRLEQLKSYITLLFQKTRMWNLARLENVLPHWLEQTQLQWVQWVYAFWQFIRANPLGLLVLSYLPFYVRQKLKRKTVVVVGETKDIDMTDEELQEYLSHRREINIINMELVYRGPIPGSSDCYMVKHNGYHYITHENNICQLAKCSDLFGKNVIFVERLMAVSGSLAVGKVLSQTEAYERLMSKRSYLTKGPKYVVPTCLDYFDYSSKVWGILSTIPILLQARNYNKCSTLLCLLIIFLDFFRGQLYKLYDRLFNRFTRFVKLNIFGERTQLYEFFSIFSSRWRYSDTVKKFAYVAKPGEEMKIMWNCKLRSPDDIKIVHWDKWSHDPADDNIFMAILPDGSDYRAECRIMLFLEAFAIAELKQPVYVP